jgi:hypothetical protein
VTRRLPGAAAALVALCLAVPAAAQSARALGVVRDPSGRPIRRAVVRATNANARPSEMTSTTDDKGRWAMIGLTTGEWRFVVDAPGFATATANVPVRVSASPPMTFTLARDLGPLPEALDKNIQQQIADANALRDGGRLDQAIAAYDDIRSKNPKLTVVNLVLADTYRLRADQEDDPAAKRTLLTRALSAYTEVLKSDDANARARSGADSARRAIGPDGSSR